MCWLWSTSHFLHLGPSYQIGHLECLNFARRFVFDVRNNLWVVSFTFNESTFRIIVHHISSCICKCRPQIHSQRPKKPPNNEYYLHLSTFFIPVRHIRTAIWYFWILRSYSKSATLKTPDFHFPSELSHFLHFDPSYWIHHVYWFTLSE